MLEVEVKYRLHDHADFLRRLADINATPTERHMERDTYLNSPFHDFARTDEALRLRQSTDCCFLTYKGKRHDSTTKTRTEYEIPLDREHAPNLLQMFKSLGFHPVAEVRKQRQVYEVTWHGFQVLICEDQVEQVGHFVEIEIMIPDQTQYPLAKETVMAIARELNLHEAVTRSYLEQLLGHTVPLGGEKAC